MDEEKKFNHPIDAINERMYAKDTKSSPDQRHEFTPHDNSVIHDWKEDTQEMKKNKSFSFFQMIFTGALVFVIGAAGFLWFSTIQGRSTLSNENIQIAIDSKLFVDGGEDLGFRVEVSNANAAALELVDMVVEYPLSSDDELSTDVERIRRPIGNITARGSIDEDFDIRLFGAEGDERAIDVTLEYRVAGSNAIFTKTESILIGIRSAPAVVLIDAPERLVSGQDIALRVTVIGNAEEPLQNTGLIMDYPAGFTFQSASITPTYRSTLWDLGALNPGDIQEIDIVGTMQGEIGTNATFRARVGTRNTSDLLALVSTYSSAAHLITLEDSFLALGLELGRSLESTVAYDSNDTVRGRLSITNTLDTVLSDVRIIVEMKGEVYDPETIRINRGRYDSNTQQLIWTQDSEGRLETLRQGEEQGIDFSFDLKGSDTESVTNQSMELLVHIRATGQDGTIYEAENVTSRTIVLNSNAVLDHQTLHASGPIPNVGSVPPAVGQATSYTIYWNIHNSSNALTDVQVRTLLPQYISWTGQTSPQAERITYNAETREVVWDVGSIVSGAGFSAPASEAYFQVSLTPSSSDVGQRVELTRDVSFSATDSFTDQPLTSGKPPHTTQLRGDSIEDTGFVE